MTAPTFRLWAAVWATIVIWAVNWVLQLVFDVDDRSSRRRRQARAADS